MEATARLLGEPGLRRDMAAAARSRCVERFSLEAVAATWLGLLAPLLPVGSVPTG